MLLFDRYGIKVYGLTLPEKTAERGPQRILAEKAAVKSLMKEAFADRLVPRIDHTESGAPFLTLSSPDGGDAVGIKRPVSLPSISVSHCRAMVAIAIAPRNIRVGIDCETGDRLSQLGRVTSRFLSPDQMEFWGEYPASLWAWCIKEALYKAALTPGLGLVEIPLPVEVTVGCVSKDAVVKISGKEYNVMQIDVADSRAILMLAFSGKIM